MGMENKINIAELLKNCPAGMELDCSMFDNVTFARVDYSRKQFPIEITVSGLHSKYLTKEGCFHDTTLLPEAKCVIYPKGKTTWEGFHKPFKDGDIVATEHGLFIGIVKVKNNIQLNAYCAIDEHGSFAKDINYGFERFATEEEKEKLFKAIKDNGYKWNEETKTLEKLIQPKFKVGDVIQDIDAYKVKITEVNIEEECYGYESMIAKGIGSITFSEQDNWELVLPCKFKVGDRIRTKKDAPINMSNILITKVNECSYEGVIGYTTNHAHISFKYQDLYELVPNKFDITTLKPFDKVLVRGDIRQKWTINFFGFIDNYKKFPFECLGRSVTQCVPYEGNEHLLGTNNECNEYYKTWV